MKRLKTHFLTTMLCLTAILSLTSCDEDWWTSFNRNFIGRWRVVEVSGMSNYSSGDYFTFQSDGYFYSDGYQLNESGQWDSRGRTIDISFNGYNVDLSCYVRQYDNSYMVLDVNDYSYNTRYTLRLVRVY